MVGIDPQEDFTIAPWLKDGSSVKDLKDDQIIVGSESNYFVGRSEINVGDKLTFYNREFTVAGVLEPTGIGIDDSGYVTLGAVYEMAKTSDALALLQLDIQPGQISTLLVNVDPGASRGDVAKTIGQTVPGVAVVTSKELMSTAVARQIESLTPGLLLIGAGFWLISVLMIGALFSMIVNERRRELGLLQAMGATRRYVFRLVMLEAVELTSIGGVAGLALGTGVILALSNYISSNLKIAYLWPGVGFVAVFTVGFLAMAVFTGVVAALYPAIMASRMEPYQAIRTGE